MLLLGVLILLAALEALANSVDPDEPARNEPSHQDLHYLQFVAKSDGISIDEAIVAATADDGNRSTPDDNPWDDFVVQGQEGRRFVKVQLDMILPMATWESMDAVNDFQFSSTRQKRKAVKNERSLWPGSIPYTIDKSFTAEQRVAVLEAIQHWMLYTCLRFRPAVETDFNVLTFRNPDSPQCSSMVGMMSGTQSIGLSPGCRKKAIIIHEIGHAIGLYHEHMRIVRDEYVTINWDNIRENYTDQFSMLTPSMTQNYSIPYDYDSVMHYGKLFFSRDKTAGLVTMEPKNDTYLDTIGEAETASFLDIRTVNAMYSCSAGCVQKDCPEGGFLGVGCSCWCRGQDGRPAVRCDHEGQCTRPEIDTDIYAVYTPEWVPVDLERGHRYPRGFTLFVGFIAPSCGRGMEEWVCVHGEWSGHPPDCHLDCILKSTEHPGRHLFSYHIDNETISDGETLRDNSTVSVTCRVFTSMTMYDYDYNPTGDDDDVTETEITCRNGSLVGTFPQNCTECSDVVNGHVVAGSILYGDLVSCDPGYELAQPHGRNITRFDCIYSVWDPYTPLCQPKSCRIPSYTYTLGDISKHSESGTIHLAEEHEIEHNVTISQICPKGHYPPEREMTCVLGAWTTVGRAMYVDGNVDVVDNVGVGDYNDNGEDSELLELNEELFKVGRTDLSEDSDSKEEAGEDMDTIDGDIDDSDIAANGTGNRPDGHSTEHGNFPVCKEVVCPTPPPITNVSYYPMQRRYRFGDTLDVNKCSKNLEFIGQHEIRCQGNGAWSGSATCGTFCEHGQITEIQLRNMEIRAKGKLRRISDFRKCTRACRRFKGFLCRAVTFGVDFKSNSWKCFLHTQDPVVNPLLLGVKSQWTVMYRKCIEHV